MPVEHPPNKSLCQVVVGLAARLPTGSFAFVMATGIVSIAAEQLGRVWIAWVLLVLNAAAFILLWVLSCLRLIWQPLAVLNDFRDVRRSPGFLTIVAGANVLGEQFSLLTSHQHVAAVLWLFASALWAGLVYGFFAARTTRAAKPPLTAGLDGSWLLVVVATQSSAILGVKVAGVFSSPEFVIFVCLSLFMLGGALYFSIIVFILFRWLFLPMKPEDLIPSYWINMGAAAIAALAGAHLVSAVGLYPTLTGTRGYMVGATMLFWSVASWWIPLLGVVMAWRHSSGGIRLVYQIEYWSMVFPLGMYTAATFSFAQAIGTEFLIVLPRVTFWVAFGSWCAVLLGMIRHLFAHRRLLLDRQW
jgi:tellurite resistance protein TehA-like permease